MAKPLVSRMESQNEKKVLVHVRKKSENRDRSCGGVKKQKKNEKAKIEAYMALNSIA